jgi:hypothetical protein
MQLMLLIYRTFEPASRLRSIQTRAGSAITGKIAHIVVVQTNPGYQPNPGHPGTGTIVARGVQKLCCVRGFSRSSARFGVSCLVRSVTRRRV